MGKALGGASGGYTTGPKQLIDLLRQKSRPYLFSNSLPPAVVGTGIKVSTLITFRLFKMIILYVIQVIDMLLSSSQLSRKVQSNTKRFRTSMTKAGFTIAGMDHPISPVMLYDAKLASTFADEMLSNFEFDSIRNGKQLLVILLFSERGIYVIGFSFPVVPKDKARIRVQISAAHTEDEIDRCTDAFIQVGKQLGVI